MAKREVLEIFADHRTIRHYTPEPLADGDLNRIIEAGRRAPSGSLSQVYSAVRVTDAALRDRLATLANDQQQIRDAAEFFVFCLDVHRNARLLEHRRAEFGPGLRVAVHYGTMDAMLLAANMATAAEALGYGTCYIGAILNRLDAVARELALPKGVLPIVGLTIGVIDNRFSAPRRPRLPRDLVFHENVYGQPSPADLDAAYEAMGDTWHSSLERVLGPAGVLAKREAVWLRTLEQQGFT